MPTFDFKQVDVFASEPLKGNPLAVVIAAEPLPVAAAVNPPIASERVVPSAPAPIAVPVVSETPPPAAAPEPAAAEF